MLGYASPLGASASRSDRSPCCRLGRADAVSAAEFSIVRGRTGRHNTEATGESAGQCRNGPSAFPPHRSSRGAHRHARSRAASCLGCRSTASNSSAGGSCRYHHRAAGVVASPSNGGGRLRCLILKLLRIPSRRMSTHIPAHVIPPQTGSFEQMVAAGARSEAWALESGQRTVESRTPPQRRPTTHRNRRCPVGAGSIRRHD
jgi:hypothetical protein